MIVHNGGNTTLRLDVVGRIRRNGSFVDILYEDNGVEKWIAVTEDALKALIDKPGHGVVLPAIVTFDRPITYDEHQKANPCPYCGCEQIEMVGCPNLACPDKHRAEGISRSAWNALKDIDK